MRRITFVTFIACTVFLLQGCPPTREARKEEPAGPAVKKPPASEIEVTVASINLSRFAKRIELPDLRQFAAELRKEKIEILAMEGLSRYPGVASRVDIVDELSREADMRSAFGETIALNGRQAGNAVFSAFPIRSSENTHYDRIASSNFEAALQAIIDCGARDVVVVSTLFPERASADDVNICANRLSEFPIIYINHPVIIAGNLPRSDVIRKIANYDASKFVKEDDTPRYWYSNDGSLKIDKQSIVPTALGALSIAHFGIFKSAKP